MSTANNFTSVSTRTDLNSDGNQFFNNFYQPNFTVSADIDGAVIAYFQKITNNRDSARILASSVIYTSLAQGVNPIETLDKFKTMTGEELNAYTTMFLNLNRIGTSYLGVTNRPPVSKYVLRSILP